MPKLALLFLKMPSHPALKTHLCGAYVSIKPFIKMLFTQGSNYLAKTTFQPNKKNVNAFQQRSAKSVFTDRCERQPLSAETTLLFSPRSFQEQNQAPSKSWKNPTKHWPESPASYDSKAEVSHQSTSPSQNSSSPSCDHQTKPSPHQANIY